MSKELTDEELIVKGLSRSSLRRSEQRRLTLLAQDKIEQTKHQAAFIKKLLEALREKS